MKQYFYLGANNQQNGPVPAESLKAYGVTRDTLVWCEGMENWAKASDVPELAPLFACPTPPTPPTPPTQRPQQVQPNQSGVCPDTYLVWSILATIFCCWPLGIVAIVNASKVERLWAQGDKLGAIERSEDAKKWCIISLVAGIIISLLSFVTGFLGAL